MYLCVADGGEKQSVLYSQYIRFLSSLNCRLPSKELKTSETDELLTLPIDVIMDRSNESFPEGKMVEQLLMPQILVNNPNITVYPTNTRRSSSSLSTVNKQPSVSRTKTVNRISRIPLLVTASPSRSVSENTSQDKLNVKKDVKKCKRSASPSASTRPKKIQKIIDTETSKTECNEKSLSNNVEKVMVSYESKTSSLNTKNNSLKCIKTNAAATSTSLPNSISKVALESTSPKLTTKKQSANVDLFSNEESTEVNAEKDKSQRQSQHESPRVNSPWPSGILTVHILGRDIEIFSPQTKENLFSVLDRDSIENASSKIFIQELTDINSSNVERENKGLPETKVSSSNMNSNIHNNLNSTSKKQVTCTAAKVRSHKTVKNQQQPCTSKRSPSSTQMSFVEKQANLNNISPKLPPSNKQNDVKEHNVSSNQQSTPSKPFSISSQPTPVSNKQTTGNQLQANKQQPPIDNIHPVLPIKQVVTNHQATPPNKTINHPQLPSINKLAINNHQSLTSAKLPDLTVTTVTKQLPAVKSSVACQSPQDVKKCKKCFVPSEYDPCARCLMSANLKGVTVTLVETPSAQLPPPHLSPEILPPTDDSIIQLSSDDEDNGILSNGGKCALEPVIHKTESQDVIKKYVEKLSLNPKLLEDKLWQKDLSTEDYFKFKDASVSIGSFSTLPHDLVICIHGIRMIVQFKSYCEPITIDVAIENIVKMLGFHGDPCTLLIYTNYLAATGIQFLLKMKENNKNNYYSPLSKDQVQRRIVWTLKLTKHEVKKFEKFLLRFKDKYEPLTIAQIKVLLNKEKTEVNKCVADTSKNNEVCDEDTVIFGDKIDDRIISPLRIGDYRMLQIEEFVNDVLMEFYLSWFYVRRLPIEDQTRSYLFNSFFYTQLTKKCPPTSTSPAKSRHNRVKKWTKNVNVFEKDFIFIPINESFHWFMAVICFPHLSGPVNFNDGTPVDVLNDKPLNRPFHHPIESVNAAANEADGNIENPWDFDISYAQKKNLSDYETDVLTLRSENRTPIKQPCILIFDSLNGGVSRARIVATLREWLAEEYKNQYNGAERDFSPASMKGANVKVPQQPNSVDCGLFVCHYFEKFFERPIVDYRCPITHLENWFPSLEVTKDCQKRKQVQHTILDMIEERGGLPPNVTLPILNFTHSPSTVLSQSSQQQQSSQNHSHRPRRRHYNRHNSDDRECDIEDYIDDDDEVYVESYPYDDELNPGEEYLDDEHDQREYYGEMANEEWPENQQQYHGSGSDYNSDSDYEEDDDLVQQEEYQIDVNNSMVNVENVSPRNLGTHCPNVTTVNNGSLRSFRMNRNPVPVRSDRDDNHNDNDSDEEVVDEEGGDGDEESDEDGVVFRKQGRS